MSCSLKSSCVYAPGFNETILSSKTKGNFGFCNSFGPSSQCNGSKPVLRNDFMGQSVVVPDQRRFRSLKTPQKICIHAQASLCVSKAMRWWEKTLKPNMVEINSAQQLVDSLLNAGDRLVIVDFYSPGCGGCRTLHPKICQLAEMNPNAIFLKVNYEELRTMCHTLHIHVLPFFRIYRGAEGRLCSFSCTNATIKKFKDALAKHGADRCSLGPAKGLDESEILKLASIGELSINLPLPSSTRVEELMMKSIDFSGVLSSNMEFKQETALL